HPKLWRDFAAAVGVGEDDITCCPALPGTQAVVETFREIVGDRPVGEAVAALYAYEAQVPEIATTKIEGLKKFYGVDSPEGLAYFEVHEEADKAHRAAWRNWLMEHAEGSEEEILATTNEALDALWGVLDAVHGTPMHQAAHSYRKGAHLRRWPLQEAHSGLRSGRNKKAHGFPGALLFLVQAGMAKAMRLQGNP